MNVKIIEKQLDEVADLIFRMDLAIFTIPRIHLAAKTVQDIYDFAKGCKIFLAYENNKPIGYIIYFIDQKIEIRGFGVLSEYQGRGIGTTLIQFVLGKFPKNTIYLVTHPENAQALHVYQKLGFTITGRKENYYGDGEPRVILEKKYDKRMAITL